mmetsp:Transcript_77702/g.166590  ORF Transcript_77702/g.166590 Transcript_77702/m.166590 type:complete len:431 (-) Transcript_77702:2717-4009(-)
MRWELQTRQSHLHRGQNEVVPPDLRSVRPRRLEQAEVGDLVAIISVERAEVEGISAIRLLRPQLERGACHGEEAESTIWLHFLGVVNASVLQAHRRRRLGENAVVEGAEHHGGNSHGADGHRHRRVELVVLFQDFWGCGSTFRLRRWRRRLLGRIDVVPARVLDLELEVVGFVCFHERVRPCPIDLLGPLLHCRLLRELLGGEGHNPQGVSSLSRLHHGLLRRRLGHLHSLFGRCLFDLGLFERLPGCILLPWAPASLRHLEDLLRGPPALSAFFRGLHGGFGLFLEADGFGFGLGGSLFGHGHRLLDLPARGVCHRHNIVKIRPDSELVRLRTHTRVLHEHLYGGCHIISTRLQGPLDISILRSGHVVLALEPLTDLGDLVTLRLRLCDIEEGHSYVTVASCQSLSELMQRDGGSGTTARRCPEVCKPL